MKHVTWGALCLGGLSLLLIPAGLIPLVSGMILGCRFASAVNLTGRGQNENCCGTFSESVLRDSANALWAALRKET